MLSSVFVIAYLMQGATALLLGTLATASGLEVALDLGSPAIGLICVSALVLVFTLTRPARIALAPRVSHSENRR